jgi:CRISPR-associated protein Cmr2
MTWHEHFLKKFFHDPIDKPFNILGHERRAKEYAEFFGVSGINEGKYSDQIASCMERSLLPRDIKQDFIEIRHPLSEVKIDVTLDSQNSIDEISFALKEISNSYINLSDEDKALLIWRNLLEEIIEKIQDEELKKYIPLLPADTRVPDHSIWEHLKITTAINASEKLQNNSLFLFTIGPVKSFISQARKAQDFYNGSFMLSYFTFIAMEEVIEKYGPSSIIYPDLYKQPLMDWYLKNKGIEPKNFNPDRITLPTIPNRFVAIIGTTDKNKIEELSKNMIVKIKNEIKRAKEKILEELKIDVKLSDTQKEILQIQLSDFPQIYWVAIPWRRGENDLQIDDLKDFFTDDKINNWKELYKFVNEKGEHSPNIGFLYQLLYTALEKSMGARKNLREFEQNPEAGRKCSVCGERNVLFYRDEENPFFIIRNIEFFYEGRKNVSFVEIDKEKITYKILDKKEGLCDLCFLKRTFEIYLEKEVDSVFKDFSFPSVAEVACADFKEKAKELPEFKEYENKFFEYIPVRYLNINSLPKLKLEETLEGSWFHEENLTEKKIRDELGVEIDIQKIKELKNILTNKLYEQTGKPKKYYAILYLDGDNMGKWLSGELLPEIQYAYNSKVWEKLPENFKKDLQRYTPNKILTPAIHSAISTALRNYAIEFVRKIVEEEHLGKLIYAGGDDVLAFVNLKDLFDVMEKLRWAFSGYIKLDQEKIEIDTTNNNGFVLKDGVYYLTMGKNATCSMGVLIAHYKEPLKIVIDKVFEMNKKAKEARKNRFAICLLKHSGEERVGVAEWEIGDCLTTEILKKLANMMNRENEDRKYISDRFIQKFKIEFYKLRDNSKLKDNSLLQKLIDSELKRLISRAYNGSKEERKDFVNLFFNEAQKLLRGTIDYFDNFTNEKTGERLRLLSCTIDYIDNFTNFLEISSFMTKEE